MNYFLVLKQERALFSPQVLVPSPMSAISGYKNVRYNPQHRARKKPWQATDDKGKSLGMFVTAREAAESHGFLVINAVPHFGEYLAASGREETREEWRRLFFMADGRPTTDAHRAWAGLLEQTIAELGL